MVIHLLSDTLTVMLSSLKQFGLSIAPPDPGCEYKWKPDPVWGEVPDGQVCEGDTLPYVVVGIVFVSVVFITVIGVIVAKRHKKKS